MNVDDIVIEAYWLIRPEQMLKFEQNQMEELLSTCSYIHEYAESYGKKAFQKGYDYFKAHYKDQAHEWQCIWAGNQCTKSYITEITKNEYE